MTSFSNPKIVPVTPPNSNSKVIAKLDVAVAKASPVMVAKIVKPRRMVLKLLHMKEAPQFGSISIL